MNKLNLIFILIVLTLVSCGSDNESQPGSTATIPKIGIISQKSIMAGAKINISVSIDAPGRIASLIFDADQGIITNSNDAELVGEISGNFSFDYTAPNDGAENITITISVIDQQIPAKQAEKMITLEVTNRKKPEKIIHGGYGTSTGTITLHSDTTYILGDFIYVNDGETLTIEAGTVVKGISESALIVERGARILAEGTEQKPIIFTSVKDSIQHVDHFVGNLSTTRGLWGGLVVLGKALIENHTLPIEGLPTNQSQGLGYGGTNNDDNSGILRYVSIRHAGHEIANNQGLDALTLAAVGSQTVIDHVEVIYSLSDGISLIGGRVNAKYLISAFNQDDGIDITNGYRGNMQFLLIDSEGGDDGFHISSTLNNEHSFPLVATRPMINNATLIGQGDFASINSAGLFLGNSIVTDYARGVVIPEHLDSNAPDNRKWISAIASVQNLISVQASGDPFPVPSVAGINANLEFLTVYPKIPMYRGQVDPICIHCPVILCADNMPCPCPCDSPSFFQNTEDIGAFEGRENLWIDGWSLWSHINKL